MDHMQMSMKFPGWYNLYQPQLNAVQAMMMLMKKLKEEERKQKKHENKGRRNFWREWRYFMLQSPIHPFLPFIHQWAILPAGHGRCKPSTQTEYGWERAITFSSFTDFVITNPIENPSALWICVFVCLCFTTYIFIFSLFSIHVAIIRINPELLLLLLVPDKTSIPKSVYIRVI